MGHEIARVDPAMHGPLGHVQMLGDALDSPERFEFGFRLARHSYCSRRLGRGV